MNETEKKKNISKDFFGLTTSLLFVKVWRFDRYVLRPSSVKTHTSKLLTKNCVYNISSTCGMTYTGETKRPLTVRIEEYKEAVTIGEIYNQN